MEVQEEAVRTEAKLEVWVAIGARSQNRKVEGEGIKTIYYLSSFSSSSFLLFPFSIRFFPHRNLAEPNRFFYFLRVSNKEKFIP
ncbi:hypothetical protein VNO80_22227 [Phaseolus coccineus]|uniref:Uncharacterized protein n=1 Tax=Phaseolus coccineus TaxID=3886 RepID=A0AAN9QU27_PHACN